MEHVTLADFRDFTSHISRNKLSGCINQEIQNNWILVNRTTVYDATIRLTPNLQLYDFAREFDFLCEENYGTDVIRIYHDYVSPNILSSLGDFSLEAEKLINVNTVHPLFVSPNSLCKNSEEEIIIADTVINAIKIFDFFGNLIKIVDGYRYKKKLRAPDSTHPQDVCMDYNSQIIFLDLRPKIVYIYNQIGVLLNAFYCPDVLYPCNIAVNKYQEIFICDNRKHCVETQIGQLEKSGEIIFEQIEQDVKEPASCPSHIRNIRDNDGSLKTGKRIFGATLFQCVCNIWGPDM
ncbi:hypothetical protein HELRODRAFT_166266 [Helobdella robusta]|uniref:Uncharacterized protein n=1 Tax=Helobdella robusta TaxID=6412 RepID=T1EXY6_HELRO|nr:hypothetical protein HELRODRAFT_166266 [Helobdella robusta]ESN90582.1 hypothetical protein HELRODRAFT_166266 [Helobdella robusta]